MVSTRRRRQQSPTLEIEQIGGENVHPPPTPRRRRTAPPPLPPAGDDAAPPLPPADERASTAAALLPSQNLSDTHTATGRPSASASAPPRETSAPIGSTGTATTNPHTTDKANDVDSSDNTFSEPSPPPMSKLRERVRKLASTFPGVSRARSSAAEKSVPPSQQREVPLDNDSVFSDAFSFDFFTEDNQRYFNTLIQCKFIVEKQFISDLYDGLGFTAALIKWSLHDWGTQFTKYNPTAVREFYANFSASFMDTKSEWYKKIYFRGRFINITPEKIHLLLGMPSVEFESIFSPDFNLAPVRAAKRFTAGRNLNLTSIIPSQLQVKYSLIFKFLVCNVSPTTNISYIPAALQKLMYAVGEGFSINYGVLVLENMTSFANGLPSTGSRLPYPCLITELLLSEGFDLSGTTFEHTGPYVVCGLHAKINDFAPRQQDTIIANRIDNFWMS